MMELPEQIDISLKDVSDFFISATVVVIMFMIFQLGRADALQTVRICTGLKI